MSKEPLTKLYHFSFWSFIAWVAFLQLIVFWLNQNTYIALFIQSHLAESAGYVGSLFLDNVFVAENRLIHFDSKRFVVVDNKCTALSLIATLWSAIFALSFKWRLKICMAIVAGLLIQIENLMRIVHLFNEIKHPINQFELYHLYIWQAVNFFSAIVIFIGMVWFASKYEMYKS